MAGTASKRLRLSARVPSFRLHDYLQANPGPIDYQRRRSMSYDGLLPEAQWINLVAEQGLRTSPPTATAARLWLIEQISGAPVRIKEDRTPMPRSVHRPDENDPDTATGRQLDTIAGHFLQTHGAAGEPPTWSPPLSLLAGLDLPGTPPETVDPNVVHDLVTSGSKVPAIARQLDASVWKVRYQLEHQPIGSGHRCDRQTGPKPRPRPRQRGRPCTRVAH